jgi:hypothetical protein
VADVPHEVVAWGVVGVVKGDGELDDAERRPEVPAVDGDDVDDVLAELVADLGERVEVEGAKIGGMVEAGEEGAGGDGGLSHGQGEGAVEEGGAEGGGREALKIRAEAQLTRRSWLGFSDR